LVEAAKRFELTQKQLEICSLIGKGATYKAAAAQLGISKKAVFWRVKAVLLKTKSCTMASAFFRIGLLP